MIPTVDPPLISAAFAHMRWSPRERARLTCVAFTQCPVHGTSTSYTSEP